MKTEKQMFLATYPMANPGEDLVIFFEDRELENGLHIKEIKKVMFHVDGGVALSSFGQSKEMVTLPRVMHPHASDENYIAMFTKYLNAKKLVDQLKQTALVGLKKEVIHPVLLSLLTDISESEIAREIFKSSVPTLGFGHEGGQLRSHTSSVVYYSGYRLVVRNEVLSKLI